MIEKYWMAGVNVAMVAIVVLNRFGGALAGLDLVVFNIRI
jgi:hypothetical protein